MSLTQEINATITAPHTLFSAYGQEVIEKYIQETRHHNHLQTLPVGTPSPDFSLADPNGEVITDLDSILEFAPLVIVFFQGSWNPYDLLYLQELEKALPKIKALGGKLIAVSPELPYSNTDTIAEYLLDFHILTDTNNELAKKFGLVFTVPLQLRKILNQGGVNTYSPLAETDELPLPATYVIGRNKKVAYAFVADDFVKRAPVRSILTAVYNSK